MGLKEAVDIADAALASGSPRINVVKAIREAYRTGASDGMKAAFGQNDETALETLNDENADLRARLANAETR